MERRRSGRGWLTGSKRELRRRWKTKKSRLFERIFFSPGGGEEAAAAADVVAAMRKPILAKMCLMRAI